MASQFMEDYLTPYEAENLIQSIKEIDIAEFGSKEYSIFIDIY